MDNPVQDTNLTQDTRDYTPLKEGRLPDRDEPQIHPSIGSIESVSQTGFILKNDPEIPSQDSKQSEANSQNIEYPEEQKLEQQAAQSDESSSFKIQNNSCYFGEVNKEQRTFNFDDFDQYEDPLLFMQAVMTQKDFNLGMNDAALLAQEYKKMGITKAGGHIQCQLLDAYNANTESRMVQSCFSISAINTSEIHGLVTTSQLISKPHKIQLRVTQVRNIAGVDVLFYATSAVLVTGKIPNPIFRVILSTHQSLNKLHPLINLGLMVHPESLTAGTTISEIKFLELIGQSLQAMELIIQSREPINKKLAMLWKVVDNLIHICTLDEPTFAQTLKTFLEKKYKWVKIHLIEFINWIMNNLINFKRKSIELWHYLSALIVRVTKQTLGALRLSGRDERDHPIEALLDPDMIQTNAVRANKLLTHLENVLNPFFTDQAQRPQLRQFVDVYTATISQQDNVKHQPTELSLLEYMGDAQFRADMSFCMYYMGATNMASLEVLQQNSCMLIYGILLGLTAQGPVIVQSKRRNKRTADAFEIFYFLAKDYNLNLPILNYLVQCIITAGILSVKPWTVHLKRLGELQKEGLHLFQKDIKPIKTGSLFTSVPELQQYYDSQEQYPLPGELIQQLQRDQNVHKIRDSIVYSIRLKPGLSLQETVKYLVEQRESYANMKDGVTTFDKMTLATTQEPSVLESHAKEKGFLQKKSIEQLKAYRGYVLSVTKLIKFANLQNGLIKAKQEPNTLVPPPQFPIQTQGSTPSWVRCKNMEQQLDCVVFSAPAPDCMNYAINKWLQIQDTLSTKGIDNNGWIHISELTNLFQIAQSAHTLPCNPVSMGALRLTLLPEWNDLQYRETGPGVYIKGRHAYIIFSNARYQAVKLFKPRTYAVYMKEGKARQIIKTVEQEWGTMAQGRDELIRLAWTARDAETITQIFYHLVVSQYKIPVTDYMPYILNKMAIDATYLYQLVTNPYRVTELVNEVLYFEPYLDLSMYIQYDVNFMLDPTMVLDVPDFTQMICVEETRVQIEPPMIQISSNQELQTVQPIMHNAVVAEVLEEEKTSSPLQNQPAKLTQPHSIMQDVDQLNGQSYQFQNEDPNSKLYDQLIEHELEQQKTQVKGKNQGTTRCQDLLMTQIPGLEDDPDSYDFHKSGKQIQYVPKSQEQSTNQGPIWDIVRKYESQSTQYPKDTDAWQEYLKKIKLDQKLMLSNRQFMDVKAKKTYEEPFGECLNLTDDDFFYTKDLPTIERCGEVALVKLPTRGAFCQMWALITLALFSMPPRVARYFVRFLDCYQIIQNNRTVRTVIDKDQNGTISVNFQIQQPSEDELIALYQELGTLRADLLKNEQQTNNILDWVELFQCVGYKTELLDQSLVDELKSGKVPDAKPGLYIFKSGKKLLHPIVLLNKFVYRNLQTVSERYVHKDNPAYDLFTMAQWHWLLIQSLYNVHGVPISLYFNMLVKEGNDSFFWRMTGKGNEMVLVASTKKWQKNIASLKDEHYIVANGVLIKGKAEWEGCPFSGDQIYIRAAQQTKSDNESVNGREIQQPDDPTTEEAAQNRFPRQLNTFTPGKEAKMTLNARQILTPEERTRLMLIMPLAYNPKTADEINPHAEVRYVVTYLQLLALTRIRFPAKLADIGAKPKATINMLVHSKVEAILQLVAPVLSEYDRSKVPDFERVIQKKYDGITVHYTQEKVTAHCQHVNEDFTCLYFDSLYYEDVWRFCQVKKNDGYAVLQELPEEPGSYCYRGGYATIEKRGQELWQTNYPDGNENVYSHPRLPLPYGFQMYISDANVSYRCVKRICLGGQVNEILVEIKKVQGQSLEVSTIPCVLVKMNKSYLENQIIGDKVDQFAQVKLYPNLVRSDIKILIEEFLNTNNNMFNLDSYMAPNIIANMTSYVQVTSKDNYIIQRNDIYYACYLTNVAHETNQKWAYLANATWGQRLQRLSGNLLVSMVPSICNLFQVTPMVLGGRGIDLQQPILAKLDSFNINSYLSPSKQILFLWLLFMLIVFTNLSYVIHIPVLLFTSSYMQTIVGLIAITLEHLIWQFVLWYGMELAVRQTLRNLKQGLSAAKLRIGGRDQHNKLVLGGLTNSILPTHPQVMDAISTAFTRSVNCIYVTLSSQVGNIYNMWHQLYKSMLRRKIQQTITIPNYFRVQQNRNQKYGSVSRLSACLAVFKRLLNPTVLPDPLYVRQLSKHDPYGEWFRTHFRKALHLTKLIDFQTYVTEHVESRKRSLYKAGHRKFQVRPHISTVYEITAKSFEKCFVLNQQTGQLDLAKHKFRILLNPSNDNKAIMGHIMHNLLQVWKVMEKQFPKPWEPNQGKARTQTFCHGANLKTISHQLETWFNQNPDYEVGRGDISNFDSSHSMATFNLYWLPNVPYFMEAVRLLGYNRSQCAAIESVFRNPRAKLRLANTESMQTNRKKHCWMKLTVEGILCTGIYNTSFRNTLTRLCISHAVAELGNVLTGYKALCLGDDLLEGVPKENIPKLKESISRAYISNPVEVQTQYGIGMLQRDVGYSNKYFKFLSKIFIRTGHHVTGQREVDRTLVTGTQSDTIGRTVRLGVYNNVITQQLSSWGQSIPWVRSLITWRKQNLVHSAVGNSKQQKILNHEYGWYAKVREESLQTGVEEQSNVALTGLIQGITPEHALRKLQMNTRLRQKFLEVDTMNLQSSTQTC